jgi:uroporphyrinogen-III synthase
LQGRSIVVTRAREQAGDLVRALEERGAVAVLAPVIHIQPVENLAVLRGALTALSAYRWVVFTSQNAVQIVFDRLVAWGLTPRVFASTSVAAIGTSTAEALTVKGVVPALVPPEFVAEALAEALIQHSRGSLVGARVLIPARKMRARRSPPRCGSTAPRSRRLPVPNRPCRDRFQPARERHHARPH